jgi:hypothetical protein
MWLISWNKSRKKLHTYERFVSSFINQSHATESVARDLAKKSQQFLQRSVNQNNNIHQNRGFSSSTKCSRLCHCPCLSTKKLNAKSWESLADGIPIEEMSHLLRKKLNQPRLVRVKNEKSWSHGIQADDEEPNPIASAGTNATDVVTANTLSGGVDDPV